MLTKLLIGYLIIGTIFMIVSVVIYLCLKNYEISNRLFIVSRLIMLFLWPIELITIITVIRGNNTFFNEGYDILKQSGDIKDEEDS